MLELYTSPHCLISSSFCSFIFVIIMLPNILKNSVRKFYSSGRNFQVEISQCSQYVRINKTKITLSWLRDHCRSEFNYDSRNNQRNFEYPKETKFKDLNVINNHLKINWQDGHKSSYPLDELESSMMLSSNDDLDHVSSSFKSPKLWAAHNIHSDKIKIDFNSYMATNIGLQYVIDNIWVSVKIYLVASKSIQYLLCLTAKKKTLPIQFVLKLITVMLAELCTMCYFNHQYIV